MAVAEAEVSQAQQVIFSVCASEEVVNAALLAATPATGAAFAGEFQEYVTADRKPQFSPLVKDALCSVAIVDCDQDPERALVTMERLEQLLTPRLRLIAVGSKLDAEFLLKAMRSGCNEFLKKPVDQAELVAALKRFQTATSGSSMQQKGGRLLAVLGVKGGVGATTLAVHAANYLVRKHQKRVLLVDGKQQLGHVALYLGLRDSKYFFSELLRNSDRLDGDMIEGFVTRHSSGLDVLPSPDVCWPSGELRPDALERVCSFLKQKYDYVIFDSAAASESAVTTLTSAADEVALICTPDVAALRDLSRQIEHLSLTEGFTEKLRVIVNRASSDSAVTAHEIQTAVRFPVSLEVPNSFSEVLKSINAGEPISPQARSGFVQAVSRWTTRLAADRDQSRVPAPQKKRFAFWG